jgi:CheY-like chemotaxis protein
MKALLVEDDELKFGLLARFLQDGLSVTEIIRAASYQAGIENLVYNTFDFVLLDMSLPVSDLSLSPVGMEWLTFGGQFVLRECARRGICAKIIVISQYNTFVRDNEEVSFDRLKEEILEKHQGLVIGCVRLDRSTDNWKTELTNLLKL